MGLQVQCHPTVVDHQGSTPSVKAMVEATPAEDEATTTEQERVDHQWFGGKMIGSEISCAPSSIRLRGVAMERHVPSDMWSGQVQSYLMREEKKGKEDVDQKLLFIPANLFPIQHHSEGRTARRALAMKQAFPSVLLTGPQTTLTRPRQTSKGVY